MPWRPLSVRNDPEAIEGYDALHDGIPPWLRAAVVMWVKDVLENGPTAYYSITPAVFLLEQRLRLHLDWSDRERSAFRSLLNELSSDGPHALDIVDGALMVTRSWVDEAKRGSLSRALRLGGSAWTVGKDPDGTPCLQRRVTEAVEQAARVEMAQAGKAARHLSLAWHKVYGRTPDASGAYREAVRAVEAAGKPVVTPNDSLATLGKMVTALRAKPGKWVCDVGSATVVADMLAMLWTSQLDRHGTDDESVPLTVSLEQAEAAVHLAATLVHWFKSGNVRLA